MSELILNSPQSVPQRARVILRTLVGSTVHGTSVAQQDDRDEMAIAVEPPRFVFGAGLDPWETTVERTQPVGAKSGPGDTDLVTHSLRKYAKLAAKGNPTILLPLFAPSAAVVSIDNLGRELRDRLSMFLSKRAGQAFLHYMADQSARLRDARGGKHGTRPELVEQFGFDTKFAGHVIRLGLQGIELMLTGSLTLPMPAENREEIVAIRTGSFTLEQVLCRAQDLERMLSRSIERSTLPDEPDFDAIDHFVQAVHLRSWSALWHRLDPSPVERITGLPA